VPGQVLLQHVVLALALSEVHQRHIMGGHEVVQVGDERLGHLGHQRRRGVDEPAVADEERGRPTGVLQLRLIHVEIHPVDALDLERHVAGQDFGGAAG
jgi:hypothetical protein